MTLENTLRDLRRAVYLGKDFNTYVTELSQFVRQNYGEETFNDFVESDLGIMFLELVAYANSTLSFYLDLQAGESYLDTAKIRNSVVRLCRNIGFKMAGAIPANTSILVSQQYPKEFDVVIPTGTQFIAKGGLFFESLSDVAFKKIKNLTGTFTLTKGSNVISAAPDTSLTAEVLFGPNGEAISVVKLKNFPATAWTKVVAINTSIVPNQIILQQPFASNLFPTNTIVSTALNPLLDGETGAVSVVIREGETTEEVFLSDGSPNQTYAMKNLMNARMVADGSTLVFVNNVQFTEKPFLAYEKTDIYEAQLASSPPVLRFGDSIAGNIPQQNAEIKVRYFATSGLAGNIGTFQITELRFPLVVNFQTVSDIQISQPEALSGGSDYFSLSRAKAEAPYVFKSQNRAVTPEDYEALASTFTDPDAGAVGKAKAIVIRSVEDDFVLQNYLNQMNGLVPNELIENIRTYWESVVSGGCRANIVEVAILTTDAEGRYRSPSAALLNSLTAHLESLKEATVDVLAFDGTIFLVPLDLDISIKRVTGYAKAAVSTAVQTAISDFLRSKNFGDPVRSGDLSQTVEGVEGVDYSRIRYTFPVDPGGGAPIPNLSPAYFDQGDLIVGKLQIVEPRNLNILFLD